MAMCGLIDRCFTDSNRFLLGDKTVTKLARGNRPVALFGCAALAVLGFANLAVAAENVPAFLDGREVQSSETGHPPVRWSATENVRWKTELPGVGWSSPVTWGDQVFLTTCVSSGTAYEPRKGLYIEDVDANKYPPIQDEHQWRVVCLDLQTGEVKWDYLAHEAVPAKPYHIKNSLASETATTDGERVYAYFGNVGLYCFDMDGGLLWSRIVEPRETRMGWGTSISPVVHGDRLYLVNDNEEQSYMLALDKRTGDEIWRVDREDEKTNYATPFVWENDVRTEIVTSGIGWARSYDLDGKLLWKIKGLSILAIPTPFARFGNLYLTSGHVLWGENPMYAVRPGASGDISPVEDEPLNEYVIWYQPKAGPYHPTPIIVDESIYVLLDRGFMGAYNAKTGEVVYGKKRIPKGRAFTSSPWYYDGKIFCINEDGVTFAIAPGEEFEVLYTNELTEDDMCMATPVIVGDKLLIRTSARVYCIEQSSQSAATGAGGGR